MSESAFTGWPKTVYEFFDGLDENNTKEWFHANKRAYESDVRAPMEALLASCQSQFGTGHIFRPNRDIRFAKDKRPYKDHIGAVIHNGGNVLYVHLDGSGIFAAAGYYMMATDQLQRFRAAVADPNTGAQLEPLLAGARKAKLEIGSIGLTRVPRPYSQDHPRAELLRHKSLTVSRKWEQPAWLHSAKARAEIVKVWTQAAPLGQWLNEHVGASQLVSGRG